MRAEIDIRQNVLARAKQRAYLARYGRQDLYRLRESIVELDRAVLSLSEVVNKENELSRAQEDR